MNTKQKAIGLVVWLLIVAVAAIIGGQFTSSSVGSWYRQLVKPSSTPPSWIFGPVWTTLYAMMAIAAWMIWKQEGFSGARIALAAFLVQLFLNVAWSGLFFGLRRPLLGLVDIAFLWIAIVVTMVLFFRREVVAGVLLIPYLLWVSFAAFLNFRLWQLNR